MSNVNKEKQNINNIKNLFKLNADGVIPTLFHEVKKAKQQIFSLANIYKDKLSVLKLEAEKQQKMFKEQKPDIFNEEKKEETIIENPISEQEKPKELKTEEENKETLSSVSQPKDEKTKTNVKTKPKQYTPQYSDNQRSGYTNRSEYRPHTNYGDNTARNQNYSQADNRNFTDRNSRLGTATYQNKTSQAGYQRYQKPFGAGNFQQNANRTGAQSSQNKSLSGILPRKNNNLTSAASAFATKERNFGNKKKSFERGGDNERRLNKKSLLRRGLIEEQNIEERMVTRKLKLKKPKQEVVPITFVPISHAVITTPNLTVKILSEKIGKPATDIIKQFMLLGIMTTINSVIDFSTAELVANELGITLELKVGKTFEEKLKEKVSKDDETNTEKRAPIVTIVGHVDHGKTSLLDYIRKTHVTSGEAGGITQTIGAYSICWKNENITFIDTPGHEAFMNMRKRGTEITDVAVLIVAGDDGLKPQTAEAIKHIKEAKVPMIVAITKIDKPEANVERIKQQLTEHDVLPEEWGGDAIIVPVSSVTGEGIDKLLEIILLVAEMQSLRCNKKRSAFGTIIEAKLDKNRGPIANIIVQNGTLKLGDNVVSGFAFGRVKAMIDDKGKNVFKAGPSMPVSVLGFDNVPNAGDPIQAVDEKFSKNVIEERKTKMAQEKIESGLPKSLDDFLSTPKSEDKKSFNLVLKAGSKGSLEALKESLLNVYNEEVKLEIINSGVGNITENDVQLAKVSSAVIVAFDTKVLNKISTYAKRNKVEIRQYNIIYQVIEDMEKTIKSMMSPKFEEKVVGHAEVRALFKISSIGTIAGCYVTDGKILRNSDVKVFRDNQTIFEGKIVTLKREKNDHKEVSAGFECGIKIDNFNDIIEGDIIECIAKQQIN